MRPKREAVETAAAAADAVAGPRWHFGAVVESLDLLLLLPPMAAVVVSMNAAIADVRAARSTGPQRVVSERAVPMEEAWPTIWYACAYLTRPRLCPRLGCPLGGPQKQHARPQQ